MPETTRSAIDHVVSDDDTSRRIIADGGDTETDVGSDAFPRTGKRSRTGGVPGLVQALAAKYALIVVWAGMALYFYLHRPADLRHHRGPSRRSSDPSRSSSSWPCPPWSRWSSASSTCPSRR